MWLDASCGPKVIKPFVKGTAFVVYGIEERFKRSVWEYLESTKNSTYAKNLLHPSSVYPSRLETCKVAIFYDSL